MCAEIITLDDQRPHIVVQGFKATHVIPVRVLEYVFSKQLKVSEIEDFDDFLPKILSEWYELVIKKGE